MKAVIALIEKLTHWTGLAAACLVLPLIAMTAYEVFSGNVLKSPTIWVYELGTMTTGAYFILGCAYALKHRAHIRIDVFYNKFPEKIQAAVTVAGYLFLFLPLAWWLSYALLTYGLEALESGERTGRSDWNPVVWPFRMVVFAGFSMLALQATAEMIKFVYLLLGIDLGPRPEKERLGA